MSPEQPHVGDKPVAEACLRNQQAIFDTIIRHYPQQARVFEIGTGTGQHGAHFLKNRPDLFWHGSDLEETLVGARLWLQELGADDNWTLSVLNVNRRDQWPQAHTYDRVYMANTLHFVSEITAVNMLECARHAIGSSGVIHIYGPFNRNGRYTSEGNRQLDAWLQTRDPTSGIKDLAWVGEQARRTGLRLSVEHNMPANNLCLELIPEEQATP
ncbi:MAG: DUF938 domain-containing protein [Oleiphilaceae bacterium]|nr:DUF938 domain-containing protein [Oleiphilaceae bacterium]